MSEETIKDVPAAYIIMLVANGFLVLVLTPLHTLFLPWINPFTQQSPSEMISSIAVLLLFSSIAGFPGLIVRNYVTGNNGLNARINRKKHKNKRILEKTREICHQGCSKEMEIQQFLKESIWRSNNPAIDATFKFAAVKYSILTGIILGAELALIVNLPFIAITLWTLRFKAAIVLTIMPLVFGLPAYLYDKYHFRKELDTLREAAHKLFIKS